MQVVLTRTQDSCDRLPFTSIRHMDNCFNKQTCKGIGHTVEILQGYDSKLLEVYFTRHLFWGGVSKNDTLICMRACTLWHVI